MSKSDKVYARYYVESGLHAIPLSSEINPDNPEVFTMTHTHIQVIKDGKVRLEFETPAPNETWKVTTGDLEHAYSPWPHPDGMCLEEMETCSLKPVYKGWFKPLRWLLRRANYHDAVFVWVIDRDVLQKRLAGIPAGLRRL